MRLDQATIPLIPRTTANCLDLAFVFLGHHFRAIGKLWAWFALPAGLLVYIISYYFTWDLRATLLLFGLLTVPFSTLLISYTARATFGETDNNILPGIQPGVFSTMVTGLMIRAVELLGPAIALYPIEEGWMIFIGLCLCIFPSLVLLFKYGFRIEQNMLQRLDRQLHDRRVAELLKLETADLLVRGFSIFLFSFIILCSLFVLVDYSWQVLLDRPILMGKLSEQEMMSDFFFMLGMEPSVQTTLMMVGMAIFPISRLAWFFCFIDVRVRRDCWDMELQMRQQARLLRGEQT